MGYIEKGRAKTVTKIILWLVVISFVATIFVTWGAQRSDIQMGTATAISVNNVSLSPNDLIFNQSFYRYLQSRMLPRRYGLETVAWQVASAQIGQRLGGNLLEYASGQDSWELMVGLMFMIGDTVLAEEARAAGVRVTDAELTDLLVEIYTDEEGNFEGTEAVERDLQIFNIGAHQVEGFKELLRRHLMASRYVGTFFSASLPALDEQAREMFELYNLSASLSHARFDSIDYLPGIEYDEADLRGYLEAHPDEFVVAEMLIFDTAFYAGAIEIADADIRSYYEANRDDYFEPESRDVRRIRVDLAPEAAAEQVAAAEAKVTEVFERLRRPGEVFASVARAFRDDPAVFSEAGVIRALVIDEIEDPAFAEAVFSLESVGDYSEEAVRTSGGLEIVQLAGVSPQRPLPLAEVSDEIRGILAEERAEGEAEARAEELRAEAQGADWRGLAEPIHLSYHPLVVAIEESDDLFALQPGLPSVGRPFGLEPLRSAASGEITPLMALGEGYAFFRVAARGGELAARFDELRPALANRYTRVESRAAARADAERFAAGVAGARDPEAFEGIAAAAEIEVTAETVTKLQGMLQFGTDLVERAFAADPPALIGPAADAGGDNFYVLLVSGKTGVDEQEFEAMAPQFRQQILSSWARGQPMFVPGMMEGGQFSELLDAQISHLVKKTEVNINREIMRQMFSGAPMPAPQPVAPPGYY